MLNDAYFEATKLSKHPESSEYPQEHNALGQYHLTYLETSVSTNREIKDAIRNGSPEGTVVTSLVQDNGYGRQGRGWSSPLGGLYLSVLLRPEAHGKPRSELAAFSLVISVALRRAILKLGYDAPVFVKWPNDILCDEGKLCGISLEAVDNALCVGIGLNLFYPEEEAELSGKRKAAYLVNRIDRKDLPAKVSDGILLKSQQSFIGHALRLVLNELPRAYEQWLLEGFSSFREEYQENSLLQGKSVKLVTLTGDIYCEGSVCDVDDDGRLCLADDSGEISCVHSGEVHLV